MISKEATELCTRLVYVVHGFEGDSASWLRELRDSIHKRYAKANFMIQNEND